MLDLSLAYFFLYIVQKFVAALFIEREISTHFIRFLFVLAAIVFESFVLFVGAFFLNEEYSHTFACLLVLNSSLVACMVASRL